MRNRGKEDTDVVVAAGIEIGVEDIEPGHWIAWVLAIPGVYASGPSDAEALAEVPAAWRAEMGRNAVPGPVRVVERWRGVASAADPHFLVNATFADDRRPLAAGEIAAGIARLDRSHRLFLELVMDRPLNEEIESLIQHLATAEGWYLRNIGLVPEGKRPDEPLDRFAWVRSFSLRMLPSLTGRELLTDCGGEGWTPRKVLRRMIWHERDHTRQIAALMVASSP